MNKVLLFTLSAIIALSFSVQPVIAAEIEAIPAAQKVEKAESTGTTGNNLIKAGLSYQQVSDITFAEPVAGAIKEGELIIRLPDNVYWAELPSVNVADGDLEIGEVGLTQEENILIINVCGESTSASTVRIADIKFSVYRNIPEGKIEVKIGGTAVNQTYYSGAFRAWTIVTVEGGECATPVPSEEKRKATFNLVNNACSINGQNTVLESAIYVEGSRIYMAIDCASAVLGLKDQDVIWDQKTNTVTVTKQGTIMQMVSGNRYMNINGVMVPMDVAPQLVEGQMMISLRWTALAFGANVEYDHENQTITLSIDHARYN